MNKWLKGVFAFIISLLLIFPSSSASAAEKNVLERRDTVIPETQMVENVAVIGGNATIYGSVRDAVIVINGDLEIKQSARIMGLVLVVGGKINQESGAQITDNVLNLTFDQPTTNSLLFAGAMIVGFWLLRIVLTMLVIILPVLTVFVTKNRLEPFVKLIHRSPRRVLLIGFITSLLFVAVSTLLSVTIVGIPLAILLFLAVLLSVLLGYCTESNCR